MQLSKHTLVATPKRSDDGRRMTLEFSHNVRTIYWELLEETTLSDLDFAPDLDVGFALLAALPIALRRGLDLHIAGAVCPILMGHAEHLVHYRAMLNPDECPRVIALSADSLHWQGGYDPRKPHLISLSGGVDSTHALAVNAARAISDPPSALHRPVTAGLLVRGFDYAPTPSKGFSQVAQVVQKQAARFDMDAIFVATNWKNVLSSQKGSWATGYAIGLAAVHHLMAGRFAGGIYATNHDYTDDYQMLHWGENAIVNAMTSSAAFSIEARSSERSRVQKIKALHDYDLLDDIRVCWSGPRTGENCGACSKCYRTMLIMRALDIPVQPVFPKDLHWSNVFWIPGYHGTERNTLRRVIKAWRAREARLIRIALNIKFAMTPLEKAAYKTYRAIRGLA